jgi:hypothetical protein
MKKGVGGPSRFSILRLRRLLHLRQNASKMHLEARISPHHITLQELHPVRVHDGVLATLLETVGGSTPMIILERALPSTKCSREIKGRRCFCCNAAASSLLA